MLYSSSAQDAARVGLGDHRIGVGLEQQARRDQARGGGAYGGDVAGVIAVALLQRWPRIAAGRTLGAAARERDEAAGQAALLALGEARAPQVPAGVGAERHLEAEA